MIVDMQEVGFGESILLQQNDDDFLVDCGTKTMRPAAVAKSVISKVTSAYDKQALVTHFDADHYNAFNDLAGNVVFDHFYLPLYTYVKPSKGSANGKGGHIRSTNAFLNDTVKVWAYNAVLMKSQKLSVLQRFCHNLTILTKRRTDITCVGAGNTISFSGKTFRVLWPERNYLTTLNFYADEIQKILLKYSEEETQELISLVEKYAIAVVAIYSCYADINQANMQNLLVDLDTAYDNLIGFSLNFKLSTPDKNRINSIISTKIKDMNNCSVVLSCDGEILLLGDIGHKIFDQRIRPKCVASYKVVKVAHHGTKAYYSDLLPDARIYLVSNSGTTRCNWGIDPRYPQNYKDKMRCTNRCILRCQYTLSNPCKACAVSLPSGERIINLATI